MKIGTSRSQENLVHFSTLGKFELAFRGSSLSGTISRSDLIWEFLAYTILHRHRQLPHSELIDILWPHEDSRLNPLGALKTLVYRTRKVLQAALGADANFIISRRSSYAWNEDYPCLTDVDEFEKALQEAEKSRDLDNRLQLYARALSIYEGDFLPRLSKQMWVAPLAFHYQSLYLDAAKTYAQLLLNSQHYSKALAVLGQALETNPYDEEIHRLMVMAYRDQGSVSFALAHYEMATDLLYRHLSVRPSENLRQLYQELMQRQRFLEMDLGLIKSQLQEEEEATSAFVVEYGFFKEAYRLEARQASRAGYCVHIGLITLVGRGDKKDDLPLLNKGMDDLLLVIRSCLRKGDIISRFSGAQYVVLLPTAKAEDGSRIMERIVRSFYKSYPRSSFRIDYKLQEI